MGIAASSLVAKWPEREAEGIPSTVNVKNEWTYFHHPQDFMGNMASVNKLMKV
jgi:hypothetical protein